MEEIYQIIPRQRDLDNLKRRLVNEDFITEKFDEDIRFFEDKFLELLPRIIEIIDEVLNEMGKAISVQSKFLNINQKYCQGNTDDFEWICTELCASKLISQWKSFLDSFQNNSEIRAAFQNLNVGCLDFERELQNYYKMKWRIFGQHVDDFDEDNEYVGQESQMNIYFQEILKGKMDLQFMHIIYNFGLLTKYNKRTNQKNNFNKNEQTFLNAHAQFIENTREEMLEVNKFLTNMLLDKKNVKSICESLKKISEAQKKMMSKKLSKRFDAAKELCKSRAVSPFMNVMDCLNVQHEHLCLLFTVYVVQLDRQNENLDNVPRLPTNIDEDELNILIRQLHGNGKGSRLSPSFKRMKRFLRKVVKG